MSVQQRRKYNPDFKRNAVLLSEEPGKAVAEIADNLSISRDLLYRWRREYRARESYSFPGQSRESLTPQEQKVRDLERRFRDAEMERDILKKAMAIFQQDTEMKFKLVKENRSLFQVKKMCPVFNVSPSGYYRWLKDSVSPRQIAKGSLKKRILELFEQHKGMVGSPIITADLHDQPEFAKVSRQRVARMIKEMGFRCRTVISQCLLPILCGSLI